MNRLRTQGLEVIDDYGNIVKDYTITDKITKKDIYAEKQNNGYTAKIGKQVYTNATLKHLKSEFVHWLEGRGGLEVEQDEERLGEEDRGLWDCCHPAAIVIELLAAIPDGQLDGPDGQRLLGVIGRTLDSYGYALRDGTPDYGAGRREIDHWVAKASDNNPEA